MSFDVYRNREIKKLERVSRQRKCRFFYFYYLHRDFGLMHVRLQSWLPFDVQVCLNGRSYLQRQLDRAGIGYTKVDNCFTSIDDLRHAQRILDRLTTRNWRHTLDRIVGPLNPLLNKGGPLADVFGYYWTIRQSEVATDVMFTDAQALRQVYPRLCRHAIEQLHSDDVERRRRINAITYRLRLLRRHGLIRKVNRHRLYRITEKGHRVMSLALTVRTSNYAMLQAA